MTDTIDWMALVNQGRAKAYKIPWSEREWKSIVDCTSEESKRQLIEDLRANVSSDIVVETKIVDEPLQPESTAIDPIKVAEIEGSGTVDTNTGEITSTIDKITENTSQEVKCEICGKFFKNDIGMKLHRGRYHKTII